MKKILKLRKQGNSLIITVPVELREELKWKCGDQVFVEVVPVDAKLPMFSGENMLKITKIV